MKKTLRRAAAFVIRYIPSPDYVYQTILSPKPLRYLTTKILLLILPESIQLPEGTLYLNPEDPRISGSLALGFYEKFETELIRSVLRPGMTVLNVGANLGYYSFIAAKHVGETGKVIAFEPEPRNFAILKKNVGHLNNVELRHEAASNQEGELELHLSNTNMGAHTIVPEKSFKKSIKIKTITVDSVVKKADLLIMDIEGAEPFAFEGMRHLLAQEQMILIFEFNPRLIKLAGKDALVMLEMLRSFGFEIYDINSGKEKLENVKNLPEFLASVEHSESKLSNLYCTKTLPPSKFL